jgi:hypothetical protein
VQSGADERGGNLVAAKEHRERKNEPRMDTKTDEPQINADLRR